MKRQSLTTLFYLLFFAGNLVAQSFSWAYGEGGLGNDVATAIVNDESGNVYITGNVAGAVKFGNTFVSGTVFEVFLAKYSPSGNLQWVKTYGGLNNDKAQGIAYHRNHIYLCGFFQGTATFGNTTLSSAGGADVFIAKTDLDGNIIWVKQAGGTGADIANAIAVDGEGNAYVCGSFRNSFSAGNITLTTSNLSTESFVMSLDTDGNFRWAKNSVGNAGSNATGISFNNNGGISVCGFFENRMVWQGTQLNTPSPSYDAFLASFDLSGNLNWARRAGSSAEDQAYAVACDKQGNTFMVGYYGSEITFGNQTLPFFGYNDAFIAKYDANGNTVWARGAGGGNLDFATGVALDEAGNCYISGSFEGNANFSGKVITDSDKGIFLASYDNNGNFRFAQEAGGIQTDAALGVSVHGNQAFLCGYYWFTCFFGGLGVQKADNSFLFVAAYQIPEITSIMAADENFPQVFPNPFSDKILLKQNGSINTLQISDVNGREIVFQTDISQDVISINLSALQPGVYFLKLVEPNRTLKLFKR